LERVLLRWALALSTRHEVVIVSHGLDSRPAVRSEEPFETVAVTRPTDLVSVLAAVAPDAVSLHNRPQWVGSCPPRSLIGVTFHNYPPAWKVATRAATRTRQAARRVSLSAVGEALATASSNWLGSPEGSVVVTPPSIDPAYLIPRPWCPKRVVLSPNRLLRKKGVLDLLAVASRREFADVTFSLADLISPWRRPTSEHRALRSAVQAAPNAELFVATSNACDLAERYVQSAVVTCPVREPEGLGLVALEAQACGVPLVTTDLGGLREATFWPNACVPAGDLDALAAALRAALDHDGGPSRSRAPLSPRDAVLTRHSPEASGAAFERWLLGSEDGKAVVTGQ